MTNLNCDESPISTGGVKYPHITVKLSSTNVNMFNLIEHVRRAMLDGGLTDEDFKAVYDELARYESYEEALVFLMRTINFELPRETIP